MFMTLLAGFKTLLLLRTGRPDICVATLMANRAQLRRERVIGPFANTTLIRTQIDADLTFSEALNRVREAVLESYARQELPFDIIAARLAEETGLCPATLVQVYFVLQVAFRRPVKLADVTVRPFEYQEGRSVMPIDRAWVSITLKETSSGITGVFGHKNDLFENTVQDWIADYAAIFARAAANLTGSSAGWSIFERLCRRCKACRGRSRCRVTRKSQMLGILSIIQLDYPLDIADTTSLDTG
jgi:non-ribosomal peptide synthetase component F